MKPTVTEVNAESVPRLAEAICQVGIEAPAQVAGQSDVMELPSAVERLDALPAQDIAPDDGQVLFQPIPADVLQMLANQLRGFRHGVALIRR